MSQKTKVPYGPLKLSVNAIGYEDGRLIQFEIYRKKGGKEELISQVNGSVQNEKGDAKWSPNTEEYRIDLSKEPTEEQEEEEEYYFKARIDDLEVKSDPFIFLYPLEINLEDNDGKPLDGVKYEIEFSDGSKADGVLQNGIAQIKAAPKGKFKIKIKGYELKE
jgi:hypothetical protein